jgi:dipeptidyl aminopeptidase/acylaminoacyl peptidase
VVHAPPDWAIPKKFPNTTTAAHRSPMHKTLNVPHFCLHGLIDDNVGAQDAFQYAEELIQNSNTNFEMMIYPSERHGFTSPHSWYDEYLRIFDFFEEHLK